MTQPFLQQRLIEQYAQIDPRDRQDTEIHLSMATGQALIGLTNWKDQPPGSIDPGAMILGLWTRQDNTIPYGEFRFVTENAQDRALRRAARDGLMVNVIKTEPFVPMVMPAPVPTLRGLIRHWLRRPR